jgi:hypothetical protein
MSGPASNLVKMQTHFIKQVPVFADGTWRAAIEFAARSRQFSCGLLETFAESMPHTLFSWAER